MGKTDKRMVLIAITVLTLLITSQAVFYPETDANVIEYLNTKIDVNTAEINRLNEQLESKQFERIAILRQIQTLIMEGKWSEVLATRVQK